LKYREIDLLPLKEVNIDFGIGGGRGKKYQLREGVGEGDSMNTSRELGAQEVHGGARERGRNA